MYGGRRIDALDALLLPALPEATPVSLEERLAAHLPTLFAGLLLDEASVGRPGTLRQLLDHGLPLPQRRAMRTLAASPEARALFARGQLELGREYYSAVNFDQAIAFARATGPGSSPSPETLVTLAVAIALRSGPENAADLMRRAPHPLAPGQTDALDFISRGTPVPTYAGIAAYDAALIRQLTAPQNAPAAYWIDVAQRYRTAASLLRDAAQQATALDRAKAADAIARAVSEMPASPATADRPRPAK